MIKDTLFKSILIPVLGIIIPLFAGLINVHNFSTSQIIISNTFFIITSFVIWQGSVKLIAKARVQPFIRNRIFLKLLILFLITAIYSTIITALSAFIWQIIFLGDIEWISIIRSCMICSPIVVFLTVIYETIFLSKERELDIKILNQLDKERVNAELNILKNELDPHFLFNSLTNLSHLVKHDPERAYLFIQKLASVYKYFLVNKDKDFVTLSEELEFIHNYYYLLKIRFDNNVQIKVIVKQLESGLYILPFTLQTLIENAIKHNSFYDNDPLVINIIIEKGTITVNNNIKPKPFAADSTKVGLKNLKARYRIISNKDILVQTNKNNFIVNLPLLKQN